MPDNQNSDSPVGEPVIHVPARDIPAPTSLSPEARTIVGMGALAGVPYPPLDDIEGWRSMIAQSDATGGAHR